MANVNPRSPRIRELVAQSDILPVGRYSDGSYGPAYSGIAKAIGDALTAPRRAWTGELPVFDTQGNVTRQAVDEGMNVAGSLTLGSALGVAPVDALTAGGARRIKAYHGSPHDFDKFDMSKIGTGEGAQAYGHGLYFAEKEGVAKSYRDALQGRAADKSEDSGTLGGRPFNALSVDEKHAVRMARDWGDAGKAAEVAERQGLTDRAAILRKMASGDLPYSVNQGRMYEVQINADPDEFLDWDKPLSEQPAAVRDIATPFVQGMQSKFPNYNPTGDTIYRQIEGGRIGGVGGDFAASALRDAGIPGIKYLDAGSRGAGDGSRNYVVFDDSLIEILRKYGIGALGLGGAAGVAVNGPERRALKDYLGGA